MQETQAAPIWAAIDVGSNTIHLVVSRCQPDNLDILADEVELVRIGESVTAGGAISQRKRNNAIATLRTYKNLAEQHGAEQVIVVATEAIREASNSAQFLEAVQRATGLRVQLISGAVEAVLTFYGATYEIAHELVVPPQLGVMDLGGGSTELILAQDLRISWQTSLPVGSGWLHDRYLPSDPPTTEELAAADTFLQHFFQDVRIQQQPSVLIVTGGSANSLLNLARRAFQSDTQHHTLSYEDLMRCEGLLCALPAAEIARRYEQDSGRVRILPAGLLIMRQVMNNLGLQTISVSPHGIREGALLARSRYGEHWLESVQAEAQQAAQASGTSETDADTQDARNLPFSTSGRPMLSERAKKFVEWCEDVLKHDDIESVHKMRVASRRLRATFDAYEPCCKPRRFTKVYRRVKDLADTLGSARDTDVMLHGLQQQLDHATSEEQAGIHWLMQRLTSFRRLKQVELDELLYALDEDTFKKQVAACFQREGADNGQS